jgi:hydrogenase maturation protease
MSAMRTLIVGIGSPHGDDQLGWHVVDRLMDGPTRDQVQLRKAKSPADVLNWLSDIDILIVCDACYGLGPPGIARRWTWPTDELPRAEWSGTHDLSLPQVLALAQRLGRLPSDVIIWGIEGSNRSVVDPLSDRVSVAASAGLESVVCALRDPM